MDALEDSGSVTCLPGRALASGGSSPPCIQAGRCRDILPLPCRCRWRCRRKASTSTAERLRGKVKAKCVGGRKRKAVFRSRVPSLLLCLSLCFSSLAPRVHTTSVLSPENKTENETLRRASRSYAAAKNKERTVGAYKEAKLSRQPEKHFFSSYLCFFAWHEVFLYAIMILAETNTQCLSIEMDCLSDRPSVHYHKELE